MNSNQKSKKYPNQKQLLQIWENDEMIWRGRPMPDFESEGRTNSPFELDPTVFSGIIVVFMAFFLCLFLGIASPIVMIFFMFICISLVIATTIFREMRSQNTFYAFNQKGVFFKLWHWGDTRIHFIDFGDIDQINCVEYEKKRGVVSFISQNDFYFKTYDSFSGFKRTYPTFEMVQNALELSKQMENLRQMRIATTNQPTKT